MRRIILVVLLLPLLAPAQTVRQDDVWQHFKYFLLLTIIHLVFYNQKFIGNGL